MPEIQYPTNPNSDTAFVVQDDGKKNRALMIAPQDISTLELPSNPNSTKGYVTVDGKKHRVNLVADITGGGGGGGSSLPDQTGHSGEFLTTDGTDASWAAVESLPTQTGNAGKFLTTDGTDASWSDKPLVNTATGNNALTILGNASSGSAATNVGTGSSATSTGATAFGRTAKATSAGAIAIGMSSEANNTGSIAIGRNTVVSAASAIMIAANNSASAFFTNSDANTFKVGNTNGNFEIMSADGTVPHGRLTNAVVSNAVTIAVADWNGGTTCTKTISGLTATSVVWVAPDNASQSDYLTAGVYASAQTTDTITFTCTTTPTSALTVNVIYC